MLPLFCPRVDYLKQIFVRRMDHNCSPLFVDSRGNAAVFLSPPKPVNGRLTTNPIISCLLFDVLNLFADLLDVGLQIDRNVRNDQVIGLGEDRVRLAVHLLAAVTEQL